MRGTIAKPAISRKTQDGISIHFEPIVHTFALKPTRLSKVDGNAIELTVSDGMMVVNKGFMSKSSYLSFKVSIPIVPSNVRRCDEDFDLLQAYLIKAYPNVIVPTTKQYNAKKVNE